MKNISRNTFYVLLLTAFIPLFMMAQSSKKTKMLLDKNYQIDSTLQPYFGIHSETIQGISIIDEQTLKENKDPILFEMLHASKDPFLSASAFQFSSFHFRSKGLPANLSTVTVNGIPMMDLSNGAGLWSSWQGLNNIFKADENNNDFLSNSFSANLVGNATNIDIKVSKQKAQTNFDYGVSNKTYNHRFQLTHSSGLLKNGWAYSMSAGGQYTNSPMIAGSFHSGMNLFLGIDKNWNRHLISINFFASNFQNTKQAYTLKESTSLFNDYLYNPSWGYQNQQVRNANIVSQLIPVAILTHEWRLNNQSFLQTAFSVSSGTKNTTALNWFHAPDPRPDYYRYLPSYQTDPAIKEWVTKTLEENMNNRQINWDQLFSINRSSQETVFDANGISGNLVSGKMAKYLLENRKNDIKRYSLASSFHGNFRNSIRYDLGFNASYQQQHFYKTINDLLGADFFVNWNQFAENEIPNNPNAIQFDLQKPNQILKTGDSYGYDYNLIHTQTEAWLSTTIKLRHFRLSLSGELGMAQFWRIGNKMNGLFPEQSFGKSSTNSFLKGGIKGVINYIINGRQNLFLSIATTQKAPYSENCYISPSTRNTVQENIKPETFNATELGYLIQSKNLKMHSTLYYIQSLNGMDLLSFYHDAYNSFVNDAISGIDQIHVGYEFAIETKLNSYFSLTGAATNGRHFFSNRQFAIVTADNTANELDRAVIYAKNYPAINSPQAAYSLSLNTRASNNWFGSISASLFDQQFLGWNPLRRTAAAIFPTDPISEKGKSILQLEKIPAQSVINLFLSHSFKAGKQKKIQYSSSISINNLLNRQDLILAGFEQLRFDYDNQDPQKFPPKYLHAVGRSFLFSFHISW